MFNIKNILIVENEILDAVAFDMDLRDGKYLMYELLAVCGDWLIVFDGKYNYMLFSIVPKPILDRYKCNRLPVNGVGRTKQVECYSSFDDALYGLAKIVKNDGRFVSGVRYFRS